MTSANDCLFCKMAAGDFPVEMLRQDDRVFAIRDIAPRAPQHLLIVPKRHIASARELTAGEHGALLGHMVETANGIAAELGMGEAGYRLTFNVGDDGGQTIYHLHLHLLGGRKLGPEG
jgi:histidine triad (HIT) family protein